ncbi:MAG: zinc ribbon domain-containing protein [Chloroflexi bacterium]|nr:zinc ribbon domain-containing protein [Chloroflexota bacterium]
MPLYEYYCERCDRLFEMLRPVRESELAGVCPDCGGEAPRIMPTSFSAMSWGQGYAQRVPYHQRPLYNREPKFEKTVAPVKGKAKESGKKRSKR